MLPGKLSYILFLWTKARAFFVCILVSNVLLICIWGSFCSIFVFICSKWPKCNQVMAFHWNQRLTCFVSKCRLYEKFGESALRSLIKFYPSILPSDIIQLCHHHPAEFLAYLDSLVKSRPEDQRWEGEDICRLSFLLIGHCFSFISRCHIVAVNYQGVEAPTMEEEDLGSLVTFCHMSQHTSQMCMYHTSSLPLRDSQISAKLIPWFRAWTKKISFLLSLQWVDSLLPFYWHRSQFQLFSF